LFCSQAITGFENFPQLGRGAQLLVQKVGKQVLLALQVGKTMSFFNIQGLL
jgi:hypothetical protein